MRLHEREKQTVFICKKGNGSDKYGNAVYDDPQRLNMNLSPLNGEYDIAVYGDRITDMYKSVIVRKLYENKIHEGDRAYLHKQNPFDSVNGFYANYEVVSVRLSRKFMTVYFGKRQVKK